MTAPLIAFLTDYGLRDEFVGVCHAVIAGICPQARVIDLTHGIPRQDVAAGAAVLEQSLRYLPAGVVLAVVDPGVGSERRSLALRLSGDHVLVGPDNGLLMGAADAGGGVLEAVDIGDSRFCLRPVSATFHGRDVFAPVAAALAGGATLGEVGDPIEVDSLVRLERARPRREGATLIAHVLYVDGFGNVVLDASIADLSGEPALGGEAIAVGRTFSDVAEGEALLYPDSFGRLALAVNRGSAAERFGLTGGDEVRLLTDDGA